MAMRRLRNPYANGSDWDSNNSESRNRRSTKTAAKSRRRSRKPDGYGDELPF